MTNKIGHQHRPRMNVFLSLSTFARLRFLALVALTALSSHASTAISIVDGKWHVNGAPTYRGAKAEGLLMNLRAVNATFEDRKRPEFDADGNTDEFTARIPDSVAHGI